ncbi:MAG: RnfABCDGE type electron transport complex subunit B [Thermodesulfobacteriota bacterium]
MVITDNILFISIMAMGGLGIFFSVFLALADRRFGVQEDPRIEEALEILPNINCGACGLPGCHNFAEKVVGGEMPINACLPGGQEVADALSKLLGLESQTSKRVTAVVFCKGGKKKAVNSAIYYGEGTCEAATLTGGGKGCIYGCLGYGDCVRVCPFDAISMDGDGLPQVFYDVCVACGKCVDACPRNLIELHPEDHKLFVYCKNKDKGAAARKICKVACIACGICVRNCPVEGGIEVVDNLAIVNYEKAPNMEEPTKKCPTKCILNDVEKDNTRDNFLACLKKEAV